MQKTIKFVTNHRLDPEKGWGLILNWLKKELEITSHPLQDKEFRIEFDIYGQGKMQDEVETLAKQYPDNIRYHGFVSIHQIFQWAMDYDFVMMPSLFLETFGLSALDFAQFGIPTIGYKKGGVAPFIADNLNISNYPWNTQQEQFDNAMDDTLNTYSASEKSSTIDKDDIISKYSRIQWLEKVKSILG